MVEKVNHKTYRTYFTYSKQVSEQSKSAVKSAVIELRNRVTKNKQFFDNLYINVCQNASDATGDENSLGGYFRNKNIFSRFSTLGYTVNPLYNDDKKEIIVRTGNRYLWGSKEFSPEKIKGILYHEIGHQFDSTFCKGNEELAKKIKNIPDDKENLTDEEIQWIDDYERTADLSDTEEFKAAWQKDVTILGKLLDKDDLSAFGEFNPTEFSDINIFDGVDKEEVEKADKERSEIFAQLFSLLLHPNSEMANLEIMVLAYNNTLAVVKSMMQKYLGIICSTPVTTNTEK